MPKENPPKYTYAELIGWRRTDQFKNGGNVIMSERNYPEPPKFRAQPTGLRALPTLAAVTGGVIVGGLTYAGAKFLSEHGIGKPPTPPATGPETQNTAESTAPVVTTTPQRVQVGGGTPEVFAQAPDTEQMTQAAAEPTQENPPTPELTSTMSVEQRAEQLANMPITLTIAPEARENAPFVTEFTFSDQQITDPITGETISSEEALRRAILVAWGLNARLENAHQMPKDELVQKLGEMMGGSPGGTLTLRIVEVDSNDSVSIMEKSIDPAKGIEVVVENWNPQESTAGISRTIKPGYVTTYGGQTPESAFAYQPDVSDGQLQINIMSFFETNDPSFNDQDPFANFVLKLAISESVAFLATPELQEARFGGKFDLPGYEKEQGILLGYTIPVRGLGGPALLDLTSTPPSR